MDARTLHLHIRRGCAARTAVAATLIAAIATTAWPASAQAPCPTPATGSSCPSTMRFRVNRAAADMDVGWTALDHDQPFGGDLTLNVTGCAGSVHPGCGSCTLSGPITNAAGSTPIGNRRCTGDTSVACTSNANCAGIGTCEVFLGPPLPVGVGGVGVCIVAPIIGAVAGTADLSSGTAAVNLTAGYNIFTGPTLDDPCPRCLGDGTPNDGVLGGTCSGGPRNGFACDTHATSTLFGDATSFDCPPDSGTNIGNLPLAFALTTGTASRTLGATSPNCRALGFTTLKCFCDTCNNAAGTPCASNADCVAVGATVCGGKRCQGGSNNGTACSVNSQCASGGLCGVVGTPTRPNQCNDDTCSANASDLDSVNEGECAGGPFETFCSIQTYRGCSTDGDCAPSGGTCTTGKFRECFTDNGLTGASVSAAGSASLPCNDGSTQVGFGGLACMGIASSSANSAIGLPGLVRLTLASVASGPASTATPTPAATPTLTPSPTATVPGACPSTLRLDVDRASADLDMGAGGVSHDLPFGGNLTLSLGPCAGTTEPNCGQCSVVGAVPNTNGSPISNRRCAGNTSLVCTSNADCAGNGTCTIYFGAPDPLSFGGVGICTTSPLSAPISGTTNLSDGTSALAVALTHQIYIGPSVNQPCPTCVGDPTPNDGVKGGTCSGGQLNGAACDTHATSVLLGATSFDCPPLSGGLIAAQPLTMNLATQHQSRLLSPSSPNCSAVGFTTRRCFCDTCNNAAAAPCSSNADCVAVGATICGGRRCLGGPNVGTPCAVASECPGATCGVAGSTTRPNECDDGVCSANTPPDQDSTNEGVCAAGPVEQFCAIETYRGCATNGDCPAGGDTCTVIKYRECFPGSGTVGDAVAVRGEPAVPAGGAARPALGALFCMTPTSSSAANFVLGLPGLGRLTLKKQPTTASGTVGSGGTVTTAGGGGATPADTLQTAVTTPTGGTITIQQGPATTAGPSGFQFLDQQVTITAPAGSPNSPLTIVFLVDGSLAPPFPTPIAVFKNGVQVNPCTGSPGQASPDPCVESQTLVGDDVRVTILTSTASVWNLAVPATPIAGKKILIKDDDVDPTKRMINVLSKDPSIVSAVPGSAHDPTCQGLAGGGATLQIFGTGGSGQNVAIALPCENWTVIGKPEDLKGYKYKDSKRQRGPCNVAIVKSGKLFKAVCKGKNVDRPINYDLTASGEGSVGVIFTSGEGLGYCAAFPGVGGILTKDDAQQFKATTAGVAPTVCPVP